MKAFDPGKDSFSVLLLGIDSRPGETVDEARSDAVLLAAVNRTDKTIKLLSIPRDSYVDIPGRGYDKIAHAHAFGSADLSVKTVENLLNIPVDYVISGNFKAFQDIVDELNGIDVTIEDESIAKQMEKDSKGKVQVQTGTHRLNGEEALAFVRTRERLIVISCAESAKWKHFKPSLKNLNRFLRSRHTTTSLIRLVIMSQPTFP
ncbi:hypothetical protein BsIDN1_19350 [Bacillus safensis]|uniref:Cell envelope-related transcriptional attenuator domain-containing protein n=1 Tax=Bacillus safensis TaxID=561879 RepID=A0A5S9M489_BACIA|nr:hypothetical protein BsIDN1_19350 [Bacillus safensis]